MKKLTVFLLLIVTLVSFETYSTEKPEIFTITSSKGLFFIGDVNDYILTRNEVAPNLSSVVSSFDTNYLNYFLFNGSSAKFMNTSGQCKGLVFWVTSTNGYDKIWYHISQPFETFQHPNYRENRPGSVTAAPIGAIDCTDSVSSDWIEY